MICSVYTIKDNEKVGDGIYKMNVLGDLKALPGQFYMLKKEDDMTLLPRAISVCDVTEDGMTFLYHTAGKATTAYSKMRAGDGIQLVGPLGNGFDLEEFEGKKVAIVVGGIGIAPMVYLLKQQKGAKLVDFYGGFRNEPHSIDMLENFVDNVHITTESGKVGHKGYVTEILKPENYDLVFCCGPEPMMRAVMNQCKETNTKIYVSLENKMACGIGACLVCTCKTKEGNKRTCKDGPVFLGEDLV